MVPHWHLWYYMTIAKEVVKIALIFSALNRKMSWPLKPFQLGLRLVNCVRHNGKTIANGNVQTKKVLNSAKWVLLFSIRRKPHYHCMHYPTSLSNAPQCPHIQEPPLHDEKSIFTERTHPHPPPAPCTTAHMPPKVWATLGVMYIKMPTTWPWVLLPLSINRLLVPLTFCHEGTY